MYRRFKCFVTVAEELHFGRAAERLGMEQTRLSRKILELERHFRTTLIDRDNQGTRGLTEAGHVLLPHARVIVHAFEQVHAQLPRLSRL